jgi:hypothetical protein
MDGQAWRLSDGSFAFDIASHAHAIWCMQIHDGILFTGYRLVAPLQHVQRSAHVATYAAAHEA